MDKVTRDITAENIFCFDMEEEKIHRCYECWGLESCAGFLNETNLKQKFLLLQKRKILRQQNMKSSA
jgi:hypothetical protein